MTRGQAEPLWQQAREKADILMDYFEREGMMEFDPDIPEEEMARACLREALVLALSPLRNEQVKMSALRTVLAYTKPKPATKSEINLLDNAWWQEVLKDHLATTAAT